MSLFPVAPYRYNLLLTFFITVVCFTCTYFFFGFYFSEYEGLNIGLLSGNLTPGMPFRSVYFSGNLVISQFYSLLYERYPGVEWISWLENLWMFVACILAMNAVIVILPEKLSATGKVIMMTILYLLVFADHQVHLIYTRVAYLICGVSLISMAIFFDGVSTIKKEWKWFVLINLFFAIGTLIRNEAAIACFLLILPFTIIYLKKIKHTALLFLIPLMMVGGQSLYLAVDIESSTDREFYKQVEPDIEEQFIARENLVPLSSMKTYRDTVMYKLAREMTLSDPRVMTPAFLRSLILPEKFMFTDTRQWNRVGRELKAIIIQYWYLTLIVWMLSVSLFVQYNFREQKFAWIYFAVFVLSFWGLTIAQAYADKVNERSWVPYMGLFILCHVLLLAKNICTGISRKLYPVLGGCAILFAVHLYHLKKESNRMKEDLAIHEQQFQRVKNLAANRYLVTNSSVFYYLFLSNQPFHTFNFSVFKKIYITDSYIIPFLPYYKGYLERDCNCDIYDYPSFWRYLKNTDVDVIVVSGEQRLQTIKDYLREIHQLDLPLKEINLARNNNSDCKAYLLDK